VVRDAIPSNDSVGRFFRQGSKLSVRTALAGLLLAGALNISGGIPARAQSQEACIEACKAEKKKCTDGMGTEDMCGADQKVCQKACEKN